MKSSELSVDKVIEQGRAIARGIEEINTQKEKNMAKEAKRTTSMIRNAAGEIMFN